MSIISPELLSILVCPATRRPLKLADDSVVTALNEQIDLRQLRNRGGDIVEKRLDGGLLGGQGHTLYPIIDRIPVLLVDEAIELAPPTTAG
jgi:uncharacterized protein YbaR (Trm112 family)